MPPSKSKRQESRFPYLFPPMYINLRAYPRPPFSSHLPAQRLTSVSSVVRGYRGRGTYAPRHLRGPVWVRRGRGDTVQGSVLQAPVLRFVLPDVEVECYRRDQDPHSYLFTTSGRTGDPERREKGRGSGEEPQTTGARVGTEVSVP